QLARPGAGEHVGMAVAVQVHKLWSEADASARGDLALSAPGLEPRETVEARFALAAACVAVQAQLALAELADEQMPHAVAGEVGDEGGGMPDVHVDRLATCLEFHRRRQAAGGPFARGRHPAGTEGHGNC